MKSNPPFIDRLLALLGLQRVSATLADDAKLPAGNGIFPFKLLKQVAKDQPGRNVFMSPYSASAALQMVANGAAGKTKEEMDETLGTSVGANQANKDLAQLLNNRNADVILEIANSIWYRQGAEIKAEFLACNQEFFDAMVAPLDFTDPHSIDIVNNWVGEKTHGRISRIVDKPFDPIYGRLFLANAVYFKGKWFDPFDVHATRDRIFHLQDGGQKMISMMSKSKTFTYQQGTDYQAVRLPYIGLNLAMYVFLPDARSSPEKLLSMMNGDVWRRAIKPGFKDEDGDVVLPKFKIEYAIELREPLRKLGMTTAFDMNKANFAGISSEPLFHISGVLQKTFVEVKEEGTEAAAVTGIPAIAGCIQETPPKRFQMIVDRPFLFLIEDNQTKTILFMSMIYDPA